MDTLDVLLASGETTQTDKGGDVDGEEKENEGLELTNRPNLILLLQQSTLKVPLVLAGGGRTARTSGPMRLVDQAFPGMLAVGLGSAPSRTPASARAGSLLEAKL